MKSRFNRYLHMLNPNPVIGGLEISDNALRFVVLYEDGSVASQSSVPLAAGTVQEGRIMNEADFRAACKNLRHEIGGYRSMPVVVSLPSPVVYAQVFSVPAAKPEQLEEAARLNLRMLSPIDFDGAYADWQKMSETAKNKDGSVDALGAFVEMAVSDAYYNALSKSGFLPVAVEFASLSLARALPVSADTANAHEPYVVISCMGDGMTLLIMRDGSPYFTEFTGWHAFTTEDKATVAQFQSVVGSAVRRFLNFYRTRWGGTITKALVMNATSNKELAEWIKNTFSLEVFSLGGYATLGKEWCVAAGAALRGLIPRAEDTFISLARVGTEDEFERNRVRRFIALWRAVAFSVLGVTVLVYIALDMAMIYRKNILASGLAGEGVTAGNAEVAAFAAQAAYFNALTEKALGAALRAVPQTGMVRSIYNAAGLSVVVTRIELNAKTNSVRLQGTARNEQDIIAFKVRLADNPRVAEVILPLSAITGTGDGKSAFTATVMIRQ